MLVENGIGGLGACLKEGRDRRFAGAGKLAQEAERRGVAGELVVVEQHPAQDFAGFIFRVGAEFAQFLGEIIKYDARLAELQALVFQHRNLAHFVHVSAKLRRAGGAVEEVAEAGFPLRSGKLEHEGNLVGVAGLGETMQDILGHETSSPQRRAFLLRGCPGHDVRGYGVSET